MPAPARISLQGVVLLLLLSLCTSCATSMGPAQPAVPDDDYFINLVENGYAAPFRAGHLELWQQAFADDAVALHNRRPADRGIVAIAAFGKAAHEYFDVRQFDVRVTDVRRSRDWAYTVGEFTTHFVNKSDGLAPWGVEQGKFVLLWERQADGGWKIILDMGNSNNP